MYSGPHNKKSDLFFGYDTGVKPFAGIEFGEKKKRFNRGKPTTNTWLQDTYNWKNGDSTVTRNATPPKKPPKIARGYEIVKLQSNDGSLVQMIPWRSSVDQTNGGTYTHSVYCYLEKGNIITVGQHWNPWSYGASQYPRRNRWVRLYTTVTNSANNYGNIANAYRTNGIAYFTATQYELGSVMTPFAGNARGTTNSLIDLKRSVDINTSNLSFNSDGVPTFDGTDDIIGVNPGTFPSSWTQPFSIEVILYVPSGATWYNQGSGTAIIGRGSYTGSWGLLRGGSDNSVYFWMRTGGNTFNPGGYITRDKYYHVVGTWDGTSQAIFYINGKQVSQETNTNVGTTVDNTGNINIGGNIAFGGSNGGYGEGTYPVVKIYSSKLSPTEVALNYRSYRRRFNL